MVDLSLFKNRLFTFSNISLGINSLAVAGQMFLMPFYLIDGLGYSALETGLLVAITSITALVIAPLSGWLSDKIGTRLLCLAGMILMCLSLLLFSNLSIESTAADIFIRLFMYGLGIGVFMSPNNSTIMGAAPKDRLGTASALTNTIRQIGFSIGMAIAGMVFVSRQSFHTVQLADDISDPLLLHKLALISGYRDALLLAAMICSIGIFTTLARGKKHTDRVVTLN